MEDELALVSDSAANRCVPERACCSNQPSSSNAFSREVSDSSAQTHRPVEILRRRTVKQLIVGLGRLQ